jgi:hypothetical protein
VTKGSSAKGGIGTSSRPSLREAGMTIVPENKTGPDLECLKFVGSYFVLLLEDECGKFRIGAGVCYGRALFGAFVPTTSRGEPCSRRLRCCGCSSSACRREAQAGGRGRAAAKPVAKSISTFKILRPDEVWQPRVGARPGNKNALKHGRYTAERKAHRKKVAMINAFVRNVLRRARRVVFRAEEGIRNRASSNPP